MNNQSFNERSIAINNDCRLQELAIYSESNGMTKRIVPEQICRRFIEFKGLVKRGSFTIDELEKRIFVEHGIVEEDPKAVEALGLGRDLNNRLLDMVDAMADKMAKKNRKPDRSDV